MAGNRADLVQGTLDMLILKALGWGPNHGFAVARWVERVTDGKLLIEEGALYPALHRMERRGWLEASWGITANKRRAKYYRVTDEGRSALRAQVASWENASAAVARVLSAEGK